MNDGPDPASEDLAKLKGLLDDLPGMVYRCANEPGREMRFVSDGSASLAGYSPAELGPVGSMTWGELIVPEDREAVWRAVREAVSRREPFAVSYRIRDRAGHEKRVAERGRGVFAESGELLFLQGFIGDATRSRRVEDELREGEERFRRVFEDAPIGVALTAVGGGLSRVNRAFAEMLGYTTEELARASWRQVTHPDDAAESDELVRALLAGEVQTRRTEKRLLARDGRVVWTILHSTLLRDADGTPRHFVTRILDFTDHERAEQELRESEERFRRAIESAPFPILIHAEDGTVLRMSRAWTAITGWSVEDIPTIAEWTARAYGERREIIRADIDRLYALDGPVDEGDYVVTTASGTRRTWQFSSAPLGRVAGGQRAVISMAVDVTERRAAEQQLRETKDYLESLVSYANAPIVVWDPELRMTRFNRAFERLTGIPEKEALGSRLEILFPEPYRAEAMERVRKASAGDRMETVEIPIRGAGGGVRTVLWNSAPIFDESGAVPRATIAQGQDVTETVAARRDLSLRAEELARSNAELEQFAYVASHDLQEPLRTVASYVQLLARRYKDRLDPDANDFIDFATEGVERMQRLIEDLLAYSRVATRGKAFSAVESGETLRTALRSLAEAVRQSGAAVTHDPLPRVVADGGQLVQLLQNLLGNALKFHGPDPPRVHVSARREGEEWVFSVKDQGIGIAPEHFERIFRVFQRLQGRREYEGTGIGLAICKKIVERHGGRIGVDSEPGRGATFWFTLPVREEEP